MTTILFFFFKGLGTADLSQSVTVTDSLGGSTGHTALTAILLASPYRPGRTDPDDDRRWLTDQQTRRGI